MHKEIEKTRNHVEMLTRGTGKEKYIRSSRKSWCSYTEKPRRGGD
jgi:hypothetical protein